MADFYKNIDYIENCTDEPLLYGVQYRVVTDLISEPVTTEFFKMHIRCDFDTDDNLITSYLKSARNELENYSQMSFGVKTMNLKALYLPKNYKLMYGYVNTIITTGYTNFGDILKEGGTDINIEYTTYGIMNETIKIAICRMAAGLYIFRENIVESKYNYKDEIDESRKMIKSISNITLF